LFDAKGATMGVLEERTALVTGGSHGIGQAIALAFAREGADIAIADRRPTRDADGIVREIEAMGRRAMVMQTDVSQEASVRTTVEQVLAAFGGIDILVNNAGFVTLAPVETMAVALWDEMIATHLRGTFLVTRFVLPGMLERGSGRIINLSSQIGQMGREQFAHYAAAKAGIVGFTKSLAREVSARGVLVNCIAPGPIATGIVPETPGERGRDYISPLPIPRVGQVDEVAPTAVFLASDASTYYTGQTLCPNGGDVML
jgi:3-oxoacyl-[acyl-carrier protein] reductase